MYAITLNDIRVFFSSYRRSVLNDQTLTRAGVLVPLVIENNELCVILTKRTDEVEHHKGQVSFPGGTMDPFDGSMIDTALREAEEEIGLMRKAVEVLGLFDDFQTPSGFCITPVVGVLSFIPPFILNKTEVSDVFQVPLSFFLHSTNKRIERREYHGSMIDVYFYHYGSHEIWGVTAKMLHAFLHALTAGIEDKKAL